MSHLNIVKDIPSILESQFFITCRWLACNYEINLDEATDILNNYDVTKDITVTKTYVLSGINKSDVYSFLHVNEKDVDAAKLNFKESPTVSIYSLQMHASESTPVQLASLDTEQAKTILSNPNASNHFVLNQMGPHVVKSSTIKLHPIGMRLRSATASAANHHQHSSSSGNDNSTNDKDDLRHSSKSSMDAKSSLFPKPAATKKDNPLPMKAPSAMVSNFFSKSNTTGLLPSASASHAKSIKDDEKIAPEEEDDTVIPNASANTATTTLKRKSNSLVIDDDDDDENWDDGTGNNIKVDKNLLKTISTSLNSNSEYARVSKRFVVDDDGDEGEGKVEDETNNLGTGKGEKKGVVKKSKKAIAKQGEGNVVGDESKDDTAAATKDDDNEDDNNSMSLSSSSTIAKSTHSKKSSKTLLQRGAMDDYFEDLEIEKEKERMTAAAAAAAEGSGSIATSVVASLKKTKQKLVEKMFADDRGYLVTQMVLEDVEINEGDDDNNDNIVAAKENDNGKNSSMIPSVENANIDKNIKAVKPVAKSSSAASSGGKSKTAAAANTGQKSMMSFFGKK